MGVLAALGLGALVLAAGQVPLVFTPQQMLGWQPQVFQGKTRYQLIQHQGEQALKAMARRSASGLVLEQAISLEDTPVLSWRWLLEEGLDSLDERQKSGDDFAARVYLIRDGGFFFWRTLAISYVWSSRDAAGTHWPNPYAGDNLQMVALRDRSDRPGKWYSESRNVRDDFLRFHGEAVDQIDAIAIMTDADDSGKAASALYGSLTFSDGH